MQVDKSCDKGETMSGSLVLATDGISNPLFFESSAGIFSGGLRRASASSSLAVVRLLAP